MKIFKRVLIGLVLMIFPLAAQAATPTATLKAVATGSNVNVGSSVSVNLVVDTGGASVSAVGVKLTYSSDLLEYTGADAAGTKFDFEATAPSGASPMTIERLATGDPYNGGSGQIIKLNFKGKAAGTATVSIDQGSSEVLDSTEASNILKAVANASITVGGAAASAPKASPAAKTSPKASAKAVVTPTAVVSLSPSPTPSPSPELIVADTSSNDLTAVKSQQSTMNPLIWVGIIFLIILLTVSGYALWRYQSHKRQAMIAPEPGSTNTSPSPAATAPTPVTPPPPQMPPATPAAVVPSQPTGPATPTPPAAPPVSTPPAVTPPTAPPPQPPTTPN